MFRLRNEYITSVLGEEEVVKVALYYFDWLFKDIPKAE